MAWDRAQSVIVLGVDPGLKGALALYDSDSKRLVNVWKMPVRSKTMSNSKKRTVVDAQGLFDMIEGFMSLDLAMAVIEEVGERPKQRGVLTAGYGAGLLHMACLSLKLRCEIVHPMTWKKALRIPADKLEAVFRAEAMFPLDRKMFQAQNRDTLRDGHAEAAMIAKYGAEFVK